MKTKQQHTTWVCVGTNHLEVVPTWFYAFRTSAKANAFVQAALARDASVEWEVYPCPLDEVGEALSVFGDALTAVQELVA